MLFLQSHPFALLYKETVEALSTCYYNQTKNLKEESLPGICEQREELLVFFTLENYLLASSQINFCMFELPNPAAVLNLIITPP